MRGSPLSCVAIAGGWLLVGASCGGVHKNGGGDDGDAGSVADAASPGPDARDVDAAGPGSDAAPLRCDPGGRFSDPVAVEEINSPVVDDFGPSLSPDELSIYLGSARDGAVQFLLYAATRSTTDEPFGAPAQVAAVGGAQDPSVSGDGLTLYVQGALDGTLGALDIWRLTRTNHFDQFGPVENVASLNSTVNDGGPHVIGNGDVVYLSSVRDAGGNDIYRAERTGNDFAEPVRVLEDAEDPTVTPDELRIFVARGSPEDIWTATRDSVDEPFGSLEPVAELNTEGIDRPTWISADGCRIYLVHADEPGTADIYYAERAQVP
jgi:hypothetical protein